MTASFSLSPAEAACIAANVYFTLDGWEATYKFKKINGDNAKGAPKPRAGMASADIIKNNVTGAGPLSVAKAGLNNGNLLSAFGASTGSNLLGRTRSGFGYMLQFERENKKHLVVATRGTRPEMGYPDLLTDVNMSTSRNMPGIGPVHAGFYDAYESLKPTLLEMQATILAADVVHCVGHSLGGAVANLVALHCSQLGAEVRLYTFGAPRVGLLAANYDDLVKSYVGEENIFRVSHSLDPIPMIPVAPYIHVLPSINDANNFFVGSPVNSINMANHDTANYINSVGIKDWQGLRGAKLKEGYLNKQYFNQWRASESWLKQAMGHTVNSCMTTLQRILQGLIDTVGIGLTEVATILDLLAIALRQGWDIFQVSKNYVAKFISDCAKMFNLTVEFSREVLTKLMRKFSVEITLAAKMALATASKVAKSREFQTFVSATAAGSLGLLLI